MITWLISYDNKKLGDYLIDEFNFVRHNNKSNRFSLFTWLMIILESLSKTQKKEHFPMGWRPLSGHSFKQTNQANLGNEKTGWYHILISYWLLFFQQSKDNKWWNHNYQWLWMKWLRIFMTRSLRSSRGLTSRDGNRRCCFISQLWIWHMLSERRFPK